MIGKSKCSTRSECNTAECLQALSRCFKVSVGRSRDFLVIVDWVHKVLIYLTATRLPQPGVRLQVSPWNSRLGWWFRGLARWFTLIGFLMFASDLNFSDHEKLTRKADWACESSEEELPQRASADRSKWKRSESSSSFSSKWKATLDDGGDHVRLRRLWG